MMWDPDCTGEPCICPGEEVPAPIPQWAALQAWSEAEDDWTLGQIRARAWEIARG